MSSKEETHRGYLADPEILGFHIPPGDLTEEGRLHQLQLDSHGRNWNTGMVALYKFKNK